MAFFLQSINIKDFKSFVDENITFEDVTSLVGANESGKSNLLKAVSHLGKEMQQKSFGPDDLRMGADGYPRGNISIEYCINIVPMLAPKMCALFPLLQEYNLLATKSGKPKENPTWKFNLEVPKSKLLDVILIEKKQKYRSATKDFIASEEIAENISRGWLINDENIDLRKNPYAQMLNDGIVRVLKSDEKIHHVGKALGLELLSNIKIYYWKYQEKDFLPEMVTIADFIANPNNFPTVRDLLIVGGWKTADFKNNLTEQTDTVYTNLLETLMRNVNSVIRKNWTTHKKLTVFVAHKGTYLTINLREPGSSTPPEYRSDGLKWFLTFLIRFRAYSATIDNHLILIDEPGLYLHPKGQKDVLNEIESLHDQHNQVIYSTHQTFLINKNKAERVRVIRRENEIKSSRKGKPFFASHVYDALDRKRVLEDKLLREALGFTVSDISPINECNILVEGVFDRDLLYFINQQKLILDLNDISIIACGKASDIKHQARLLNSNGLKVVCLYDSDSAGKTHHDNNRAVKKSAKHLLNSLCGDKKYETAEDLIPEKVFSKVVESWYKRWSVKDKDKLSSALRPRMRKFNNIRKGNEHWPEMKHDLEDSLLQEYKTAFKVHQDELKNIVDILRTLQKSL